VNEDKKNEDQEEDEENEENEEKEEKEENEEKEEKGEKDEKEDEENEDNHLALSPQTNENNHIRREVGDPLHDPGITPSPSPSPITSIPQFHLDQAGTCGGDPDSHPLALLHQCKTRGKRAHLPTHPPPTRKLGNFHTSEKHTGKYPPLSSVCFTYLAFTPYPELAPSHVSGTVKKGALSSGVLSVAGFRLFFHALEIPFCNLASFRVTATLGGS
jgi:hypothetical protein